MVILDLRIKNLFHYSLLDSLFEYIYIDRCIVLY